MPRSSQTQCKNCLYNFSRHFSSSLAIEMYGSHFFSPCYPYIESTVALSDNYECSYLDNNIYLINTQKKKNYYKIDTTLVPATM